jgi:hypothetical protein
MNVIEIRNCPPTCGGSFPRPNVNDRGVWDTRKSSLLAKTPIRNLRKKALEMVYGLHVEAHSYSHIN